MNLVRRGKPALPDRGGEDLELFRERRRSPEAFADFTGRGSQDFYRYS